MRFTQTDLGRLTARVDTFETPRGWTALMQKSDRSRSEGLDSASRHPVDGQNCETLESRIRWAFHGTEAERSHVSGIAVNIRLASAPLRKKATRIVFEFASSANIAGRPVGDLRFIERIATSKAQSEAILNVSLGKKSKRTSETLRRACGAVARFLVANHVTQAEIDLSSVPGFAPTETVSAVCEGLLLGAFQFRRHKSPRKASPTSKIHLLVERRTRNLTAALKRALLTAEATNLARAWSHEPPNILNPVTLAQRTRRLARDAGLKCTVYDEKRLAQMKAGALLAVGMASKTPPRLLVLEYSPRKNRGGKAKPVILVGKAVTFDTGGYSLKDKTGIVGMKFDKCGGMAVLGVMQAVAKLEPPTPVIGIVPAAENMIAGNAYRPNDIVTTMSGKTVEIISTDAEGRMILADALTFALQNYKPRAVIDVATLTGGVVVALGAVRAGLFSNHDGLAKALIASGENVHEKLWRLPLDEEYLDLIKGDDSDLKNSGGRHAHPIIGAIFLKQFVRDDVPWAHLDIAGTATTEKNRSYRAKGATGFGVRLLIDFIMNLKGSR